MADAAALLAIETSQREQSVAARREDGSTLLEPVHTGDRTREDLQIGRAHV